MADSIIGVCLGYIFGPLSICFIIFVRNRSRRLMRGLIFGIMFKFLVVLSQMDEA